MTARGPLFEVADDDDDDEDKKLSAKATTKVTQSGQVIPSEEGQAGVFDDQEVVNLVSPQGAIGWKRSRTASERTYLVPLGGAKRDDLGTLQGILDESDPQLDMSDSRTFGLDPCFKHYDFAIILM